MNSVSLNTIVEISFVQHYNNELGELTTMIIMKIMQKWSEEEENNSDCKDVPEWLKGEVFYRRICGC